METKEYGGFRKDRNRIMKGAKAIGKVHGRAFLQEKFYPRHYLRKHEGFGVSIGLLNLLSDLGVSNFVIEVMKGGRENRTIIDETSARVSELIVGKKIQYPGFDEQRLFKWRPKHMKEVDN